MITTPSSGDERALAPVPDALPHYEQHSAHRPDHTARTQRPLPYRTRPGTSTWLQRRCTRQTPVVSSCPAAQRMAQALAPRLSIRWRGHSDRRGGRAGAHRLTPRGGEGVGRSRCTPDRAGHLEMCMHFRTVCVTDNRPGCPMNRVLTTAAARASGRSRHGQEHVL